LISLRTWNHRNFIKRWMFTMIDWVDIAVHSMILLAGFAYRDCRNRSFRKETNTVDVLAIRKFRFFGVRRYYCYRSFINWAQIDTYPNLVLI
jgi:hypothetical protein